MAGREGEPQHASNRSKRRYFQQAPVRYGELGPGMRGVLVSCDVHVERDAIRECFRLFESLAEQEDGPVSEEVQTGGTAGDALAREIAAMRQQKQQQKQQQQAGGASEQRRFSVPQTGCAGNVFIRFEGASVDPLQLVTTVMEQALATRAVDAPHVVRMLPVQITCPAKPSAIDAELRPLLPPLAGTDGTYAVQWRRRHNATIDKMAVIDTAATAVADVAPAARVDLKQPDTGVLVDVIKTTACLALLPNWQRFHQYNLRAIVEAGVAPADRQAVAPAPEASTARAAGAKAAGSRKAVRAQSTAQDSDGGGGQKGAEACGAGDGGEVASGSEAAEAGPVEEVARREGGQKQKKQKQKKRKAES